MPQRAGDVLHQRHEGRTERRAKFHSVVDGWWIEGRVEGVTGLSIGNSWKSESDPSREVAAPYN
ncbi:MAG: hypothetical protein JRI67_06700 [Deltaproteobacteria bacterium]|nr:hypothetical protein [Deltaproteobacteria bacterium]MBW1938441.1 hypothetical protein [Deltaproteobacteria bacterium]